jgi:hypothetical protein
VIIIYGFLFTILPKFSNAEVAYNRTIFLLNSSVVNGKFYDNRTNKSNDIESFKYSVLNVTEISGYKLQDINLMINESNKSNKSSEFSLIKILVIVLSTTFLLFFLFIGCLVFRFKYNMNKKMGYRENGNWHGEDGI